MGLDTGVLSAAERNWLAALFERRWLDGAFDAHKVLGVSKETFGRWRSGEPARLTLFNRGCNRALGEYGLLSVRVYESVGSPVILPDASGAYPERFRLLFALPVPEGNLLWVKRVSGGNVRLEVAESAVSAAPVFDMERLAAAFASRVDKNEQRAVQAEADRDRLTGELQEMRAAYARLHDVRHAEAAEAAQVAGQLLQALERFRAWMPLAESELRKLELPSEVTHSGRPGTPTGRY